MPEIGEQHEVEIHGAAYGGDGVARLANGMTVFVPFTAIGDAAKIELVDVRKRFARATLTELLSAGPDRLEPRCPLYGQCGGCQYQHITDETELMLKQEQLGSQLKRMGGLADVPEVEMPESDSPTWDYRNKITLHRDPRVGVWGFVGGNGRTLLPVESCPIACREINMMLAEGKLESGTGNDLVLRRDSNGEVWQSADDYRAHDVITEELFGIPVRVPQGGFYQVNPPVFESLARWLQSALEPDPDGLLVDAYCGIGVFSLCLAQGFAEVRGVESHPSSIPAAVTNADRWGLRNVEFITGRVESYIARLLTENKPRDCTVLLDPPRGGCSERVICVLAKHMPSRIVYVACDPTSLARDLKRLGANHYRITRLGLFNMFPQTAHFETVAILKRIG